MDFDPRITSDGSGYGAEYGWGCNFSFGYGYDIIDEDAKVEKCRVQALSFLIAKADAEIHDLEDELAILQCQLKWIQSDTQGQGNPYEVCCTAFKRKIDTLNSSIPSLGDGVVLRGHAPDEMLQVKKPAERVHDIINALISQKFLLPDEQQAAGFESSMESEEPTAVIERQDKPTRTISEESSSDAAKYALKDAKEVRNKGKSDIEMTGRAQLGTDGCTSEQRMGLTVNPTMSPTDLQASAEEFLISDVLAHGENEQFLAGSKIGESGLTSLSAKILVKFEDDFDTNVQHVAHDSLPKRLGHELEHLLGNHVKEAGHRSQSLVNTHITYNRRKFSTSSILKGQKPEMKSQTDVSGIESGTPNLTLKPQKKSGKRDPSISKSFGLLGIPSSKVEATLSSPEPNLQNRLRIDEGTSSGNHSGVLGTRKRQIQGPIRESIESIELQSMNGGRNFLTSPEFGEADGSIVTSDSANASTVAITEEPINNLENLRLKLSEDPDFLKKLKVSELKAIMKQNKIRGFYKLKKESIVEEVTKLLLL